eukprot:jgi/Mesvir1/12831/Mv20058-RA.1
MLGSEEPVCQYPSFLSDDETGCPSRSCGVGPLDTPCCPCLEKLLSVFLNSKDDASGRRHLQQLVECGQLSVGGCPLEEYVLAMARCDGSSPTSSANLTSLLAEMRWILAGGVLAPPTLRYSERGFGGVPPSPTIAVGPNHAITVVRSSFTRAFYRVYMKSPWLQVKQSFLTQFHRSNTICRKGPFQGAPHVAYDHLADRWLIMEYARNVTGGIGGSSTPSHYLCLVVSLTGIPYGLLYRGVAVALPGGDPGDALAFASLPDAFYFGTGEDPPAVYALDRARMLAGGSPRPMVRVLVPAHAGAVLRGLMLAHLAGRPRAGSACGYFLRPIDDELAVPSGASANPGSDFVEVWRLCPSFDNPAAANFSREALVSVSEFSTGVCGDVALQDTPCVAQPGSTVALASYHRALTGKASFRSFADGHDSLLATFTVNAGNNTAGVMWVELRRSVDPTSGVAGPWERSQDGVLPYDGAHRWLPHTALDREGNVALGYSVMDASRNVYPSLYYSGRGAFAPPGIMLSPETLLIAGTAASTTSSFGGQSSMAVDPMDGCSFYFVGPWETRASRSATYIGAVHFPSCKGSAQCSSNTDCNDGQFCSLDKCRDGVCVSEPDLLLCRYGEVCDEQSDSCIPGT